MLHVVVDSFLASVELARRPQLRGRPVIVGGPDRGAVLDATDGARVFGVRPGMPLASALRLCPQAVVIPPDRATYRDVSSGVMAVLRDVTPLVVQVGPDEAFLDVSGVRRRLGPPTTVATLVRAQVREEFGLTCSVGVAATRAAARLASRRAGPDGVLLVPRAATLEFLRDRRVVAPVRSAPVPDSRAERTVARLEVASVRRAVGRGGGPHLVDLAWASGPRGDDPGADGRSLGAEERFDVAVADLSVVDARAHELAERCVRRLRGQGVVARTVSITVGTSDSRTLTRSRTLTTPTDMGREVYLIARELLAAADLDESPVRFLGVRAEGLSSASVLVRRPTPDEAVDGPGALPGGAERSRGAPCAPPGVADVDAGARRAGREPRSTTTIVPADLS